KELQLQEKIDGKILRQSIVIQRMHVQKYLNYMCTSRFYATGASLTQFYAYLIEQLNRAETLFDQYFNHLHKPYINRFPKFIAFLINEFTYTGQKWVKADENEQLGPEETMEQDGIKYKMTQYYHTSPELMHLKNPSKLEYDSSKRVKFNEMEEFII